MNSLCDLTALLDDCHKVVALAGISLPPTALSLEIMSAPHKPPTAIRSGKMAVYVFVWNGQCLKVGKVGPKSQARFTSQHYNPTSSNSNLAKSLVTSHKELGLSDITESNVGAWIMANVDRVHLFLNVASGIHTLTLLESFLQCRLKPLFEGFDSQRNLTRPHAS